MNLQFKISTLLSFDGQIFSQKFDNWLKLVDDRYLLLHILDLIRLRLYRYLLLLKRLHLRLQPHYHLLELVSLCRYPLQLIPILFLFFQLLLQRKELLRKLSLLIFYLILEYLHLLLLHFNFIFHGSLSFGGDLFLLLVGEFGFGDSLMKFFQFGLVQLRLLGFIISGRLESVEFDFVIFVLFFHGVDALEVAVIHGDVGSRVVNVIVFSSSWSNWRFASIVFVARIVCIHWSISSWTLTIESFIIISCKVQWVIIIRSLLILLIWRIHKPTRTLCSLPICIALLCTGMTRDHGTISNVHIIFIVCYLMVLRERVIFSVFIFLTIFVEDVLCDLHQVIQSLFV